MNQRSTGLAALLLACLAASAAGAGTAPAPAAGQANARAVYMACRSDLSTHCSGISPGGGRIKACMLAHHDELSPGCRAAFDQATSGK